MSSPNNGSPRITNGYRVPEFNPRTNPAKRLLRSRVANLLTAPINALMNIQVKVGGRAGVVYGNNGVVITVPRNASNTSSSTSSAGFHPFKVYTPAEAAANTFRIRGGYCIVPELFPSNTTRRKIDVEFSHRLEEVDGDGIAYTSDDEGAGTNDIILDNWDNGTLGVYSWAGIWLQILQDVADPGVIDISVQTQFLGFPALSGKIAAVVDSEAINSGAREVQYIPLALIYPTGYNGNDITGARIHQFRHTQVTELRSDRGMNFCGEYIDTRVYWPGDVVFAADGQEWVNRDYQCTIGYDPGDGDAEWSAID